jgi:hypothetical protein
MNNWEGMMEALNSGGAWSRNRVAENFEKYLGGEPQIVKDSMLTVFDLGYLAGVVDSTTAPDDDIEVSDMRPDGDESRD